MTSSTLAIIPARGGSKRIPRKNLREVDGKPLIAHTIEHAKNAGRLDRAIISSDDEEIIQVAEEHGGDVPFKRPAELATDTAALAETVTHALDWVDQEGEEYDHICALQVTCPLRTSDDIDAVLRRLEETKADSAVSISEYVTPPQWAVADDDDYLYEFFDYGMLWAEGSTRSQDIPTLRHPNGAVFAATTEAWRTHETFYTPKTAGYEMPPERSFDIDDPWELELIRNLLE